VGTLKLDTPTGCAASSESSIFSFSTGVSNTLSIGSGGGGAGAGKATFSGFGLVKPVDRLSAVLFCMAASGAHSDFAEIEVLGPPDDKGRSTVTAMYRLELVFVSSISSGAGSAPLLEQITLNPGKMRQTVDPFGPNKSEFCWDVVENKKC
jgi:type VI protein secretion system component Hcp